jgi:UDP-N-acetylmuramate--alanine ligase
MTRIHLIGIGGTGLSAIARVLLEMGHTVSGSDSLESSFTHDLEASGAVIHIGHRPENIRNVDLVVRSSAIPDDNPEVIAARAFNILVLKRADFLGSLMDGKTGIAVAGTHGKTSTTAMIAWLLLSLKKDPSFIVGGVLTNLGVNARAGKGPLFVIEADEYDRMFLGLRPVIEVVTNIEHDHPDCYPTLADFQEAFVEFMYKLPVEGTLIACHDDPGARSLLERAETLGKSVITYGMVSTSETGKLLQVSASKLVTNDRGGFSFDASVQGSSVHVDLQVPGRHNVLNALAALAVSQVLMLPLADSARALEAFTGTKRRFEVRGEVNGIVIVDDYAHHPSEIIATLAAARARYPSRRIWAVWQPHTYSRTQTLSNEFAAAFIDADKVIVTEVYPAREPQQAYSSRQVVDAMTRQAHFIPSLPEVSDFLSKNLLPGDALLVLSAGDADRISTEMLTRLKEARNG